MFFIATAGAAIYSSESDGSDVETRRARRLDRAKSLKALKDSDSEGSDPPARRSSPSPSASASRSPSASNSEWWRFEIINILICDVYIWVVFFYFLLYVLLLVSCTLKKTLWRKYIKKITCKTLKRFLVVTFYGRV